MEVAEVDNGWDIVLSHNQTDTGYHRTVQADGKDCSSKGDGNLAQAGPQDLVVASLLEAADLLAEHSERLTARGHQKLGHSVEHQEVSSKHRHDQVPNDYRTRKAERTNRRNPVI